MECVIDTPKGRVRGTMRDGVAAFKGIPYAAPPFGPDRLEPPLPARPWDGVRDALSFGPTPPQPPYRPPFDDMLHNPVLPGDDCLNLNIWTPEPGSARLPVMVWIHGGAFTNGSGAVPTYDGRAFARDGIVCITINYRLGVEGFAQIAGAPSNRGLLDQVAALEWVRDSIAPFGGDPDNVTIFGESAGGMSVASLLSMPRAEGLFRRAIAQSGAGHHAISAATADRISTMLAARLGAVPTREALAALPAETLVEAQAAISLEALLDRDPQTWGEVAANQMAWEPVVDGEVLPARPIDRIAAGAGAGVDVMTGTTIEEERLFLVPTGLIEVVPEEMLAAAAAGYGLGTDGVAVYRSGRPGASPGDLFSAVATDWFFRIPALRLAEAHEGHVYEFGWRSPAFDGRLGACHALEIAFVFDALATERGRPLGGDQAPQALADAMHGAWVAFARNGDPGWPRYRSDRRATMSFGETCKVVEDPRAEERRLWDGIR